MALLDTCMLQAAQGHVQRCVFDRLQCYLGMERYLYAVTLHPATCSQCMLQMLNVLRR